jgi:SAM-dependent methyltransferase
MNAHASGFDRLARCYRALEFIAFGGELERARFAYLDRLAGCRDILLLGEGDGRCAARLAGIAPRARILCIDSSPAMIKRAARRIGAADAGRVTFLCEDATLFAPEPGRFDAVATLFFLDCFDDAAVDALVACISPSLRPGAPWLFADFAVPRCGAFARLRARAWLAVLYAFFRMGAGLRVSVLPASEEILGRAGWAEAEGREFQGGIIRSAVLRRAPTGAPAASP